MKEEQALSEIGRLSRELTAAKSALKQAERALEPFAKVADDVEGVAPPLPDHTWLFAVDDELTLGECRAARQALSSIRQTRGGSGAEERPSRGSPTDCTTSGGAE